MSPNDIKWQKYLREEAVWIDSIVRSIYPRWLTRLAETRLKFLQPLIVKYAKLRVESNKHLSLLTKGFRGPKQRLDAITTKVYRGEKLVGERKFLLDIIGE